MVQACLLAYFLVMPTPKSFYNDVYREGHASDYGGTEAAFQVRTTEQLAALSNAFSLAGITRASRVLEVGCGMGYLKGCHPNWTGIEYSGVAVARAKERYGADVSIYEGDARDLQFPDGSFDFVYSFATLEHVPKIERALQEIARVTKPGGVIMLAPAWNCRPWTVKKLQQRPYSELSVTTRIEKALIPIRDSVAWRAVAALPARLKREALLALGMESSLDYRELSPDFSLADRYPHISDDDAFVSIDAHAALTYFVARGWVSLSHPTRRSRLLCRAEPVLLKRA